MPIVPSPPGMPTETARTIDALGNRARQEIVRQLSLRGPATSADLDGRIGASISQINRHLTILETAGLIQSSLPAEDRRRRVVHWSVDPDAVRAAVDRMLDYLLPEQPPPTPPSNAKRARAANQGTFGRREDYTA